MIRDDGSPEPTALDVAGSFSEVVLDAVPVESEMLDLVSIKQLTGKKVWEVHPTKNDAEALKRIGRVLAFVFHPTSDRCIGFLVKRPDAALMFRRANLFVSFGGFDIVDGHIVVGNAATSKGKKALKAAGVDLDECVIWQGLPVVCEDGDIIGAVGDVLCELGDGSVYSLEVSKGAAANALLGTLQVPSDEVLGFCVCEELASSTGSGSAGSGSADSGPAGSRDSAAPGESAGSGAPTGSNSHDSNAPASPRRFPAIMVKDTVRTRPVEGGVAEKAGSATAVVAHNAKQVIDKVKPKAKEAGAAAGDAVNKGAYIAGRQIGRTKGMFSAFKEEFDKALHDEGGEQDKN